jgi:tetratricopeptide (TPR) repeat protein/tRNA A-37 threonylcarbamoyl transferase component Bud32
LADLRQQLDRALGSSYRIERELGGGGMSRVFLAEEVALKRQVVIKVLPPEMAAGVSTDRFRREIEVAARLQHPHIVPLLAAGSAEDLLYYVMPFIQGESLRDKLAREGELPVPEAMRILREVTDALGFAHAQGVVHRDVKPDNVMLSSGHALVTDFGVAKALEVGQSEAPADEPSGLTSVGVALGTPTYMAPEQAAADPHVDHRADIYALGVMAYEMLAGQPPFTAPTTQALLAAHITQEPDSVRRYRNAVPEELDDLVMRCLAKRAADRYQHATDLLPLLDTGGTPSGGTMPVMAVRRSRRHPGVVAAAFLVIAAAVLAVAWVLMQALGLPDWVVSAAVVLLIVGFPVVFRAALRERTTTGSGSWLGSLRGAMVGGGVAFLGLAIATGSFMGLRALGVGPFATLLSAGTLTERDRILVAEFENGTSDSLLGATLTEALTIDLSQSSVLRLVPPGEVSDALDRMQRERNTPLTSALATEIAAREGIKAIVVGEIAPLADGYILSARVLSSDGETLFATRATADGAGDLLGSLETLSRKLREGIGESLKSIRGAQGLEQVTTTSLEALELYTRAIRDWTDGQKIDGVSLLRQAVTLDPEFAMAWRRLSADLTNANGDPAEILATAQKAYDLRDRLTQYEALHMEADYATFLGDFDRVVETYQRILASWPDDPPARNNLGLYLRVIGRYSDSEQLMKPAVDSGVAPASTYYNLVATQIPQGKFDAAEHTVALMTERMPDTPMRWQLASYLEQGRNNFDAALLYADSLTSGGPRYRYWGFMSLSEVYRVRGQMRDANRASRLAADAQREQGSPGNALRVAITDARADLQFLGDSAGAASQLDALLIATPLEPLDPMSRPYGDVIRLLAELGRLAEARALRDEYEGTVLETFRNGDARGLRGLASLAAADGQYEEAVRLARRAAYISGCDGCTGNQIALSFEAMGQVDSAIVEYERLLRPPTFGSEYNHWRSVELPFAYRRLGELYEAKGERSLAADRYAAFADLWENADPELLPAVTEVRERLALLSGEE